MFLVGIAIVIILMSPAMWFVWWHTLKMVRGSKEIQKQRQEELSYAYAAISTAPLPAISVPNPAPVEVDLRYDADVICARAIVKINQEFRQRLANNHPDH